MSDSSYLRISEAARLLGVSASSLRNWERIGLIRPIRSQGRYRLYSRDVLARAKEVQYLRTVKRLNPEGILHVLNAGPTGRPKARAVAAPRAREARPDGKLGHRLYRLRCQQRMTVTAAARKAGISPSFLSAIERGRATPSVAAFQKLVQIYKTTVLSFFGEPDNGRRRLVRPRDRKLLQPQPGIRIEQLAFGDAVMEVQLWRIAPGAGSGGSYQHDGQEFIFVLRGALEIWLDEVERYIVQRGDSLYFDSTDAHRWRNPGKVEAVLLWVNTPPSF